MKFRNILLIVGGISFIALVVSLSLLLADRFQVSTCGCPKVISQNFVYLFIILSVIFVASLLYYLFSIKIDSQGQALNKNKEILYSILDEEEKAVLSRIIRKNGEISQSEISETYGKLRAHRIIHKLKEKKIIQVTSEGKTNKIKLSQELRGELI